MESNQAEDGANLKEKSRKFLQHVEKTENIIKNTIRELLENNQKHGLYVECPDTGLMAVLVTQTINSLKSDLALQNQKSQAYAQYVQSQLVFIQFQELVQAMELQNDWPNFNKFLICELTNEEELKLHDKFFKKLLLTFVMDDGKKIMLISRKSKYLKKCLNKFTKKIMGICTFNELWEHGKQNQNEIVQNKFDEHKEIIDNLESFNVKDIEENEANSTIESLTAHVESRDLQENTPLHLAASKGNENTVKSLLNCGNNINAKNLSGETALHVAAKFGHKNVLITLIANGADLEAKDLDNKTALYSAAFNGHNDLVKIILESGADIEVSQKEGNTPLHAASHNGHNTVVNTLLKHGAYVNAKNNYQETPLYRACESNNADLVKILLKFGASTEIRDKYYGRTALHWASFYGHNAVVNALLDHGADINSRNHYEDSPLHEAARLSRTDVVLNLLARGADLNLTDKFQRTALDEARCMGHNYLVDVMQKYGTPIKNENQ